jgi:hypothetical protein
MKNPTYKKARVAIFDIETAPNLGYTWGKWEQNVISFKKDWFLLSFSMKWADEKKIYTYGLPDFRGYKKDKTNDRLLSMKLWEMMNEADIIVAHNGNNFDIKKANSRFIYHGLTPPAPYKTVDTLLWARRNFKFDSNKLDDLGSYFKIGNKLKHTGFNLWLGCMEGDMKSWKLMKKYNEQDVRLLEKVYLRLRPWSNHPNMRIYDGKGGCPFCGSVKIQKRGLEYSLKYNTQKLTCTTCGKWFHGEKIKK